MSVSIDYVDMGKSYTYNGNTYQVFGTTATPSVGYGAEASGESYYDCTSLSYNSEFIFIWICRFSNTGNKSTKVTYRVDLQAKVGGTWTTRETPFKTTTTLQAGYSSQIFLREILSPNGVDETATEYRIRVVVADADGNDQMYSFFDADCPPLPSTEITVVSNTSGKSLMNDGTTVQTFWGKEDGSINLDNVPFGNTTSADGTIDCSNLQIGHYVAVSNFVLEIPNSITADEIEIGYQLQGYINGAWETLKYENMGIYEVEGGYYWSWWTASTVVFDQIWTDTNQYRVQRVWVSQGGNGSGVTSSYFNTTNLNIDTTKAAPGCVRIDGGLIRFTDERGYIHKIDSDNNSDGYVGTEYKGSVWLTNQYASDMRKLFYVTQTGYIRHTHLGRLYDRNQGTLTPGTQYRGSIWVEDYYICFIDANGRKVYVGNGDV